MRYAIVTTEDGDYALLDTTTDTVLYKAFDYDAAQIVMEVYEEEAAEEEAKATRHELPPTDEDREAQAAYDDFWGL